MQDSIKVKNLIKELEKFDPELEVNYDDEVGSLYPIESITPDAQRINMGYKDDHICKYVLLSWYKKKEKE